MESAYFKRLTSTQFQHVKDIHLFAKEVWLERGFSFMVQLPMLRVIERLKIIMASSDWKFEGLNSGRVFGDRRYKSRSVAHAVEDGAAKLYEKGWGSAFKKLKGLKEIELELEMEDRHALEFKGFVEVMKGWEFPCADD